MKIIKISSSDGSYCSTSFSSVSKELKKKIQQSMKRRTNEKFIIEVFDMNDSSVSLGSGTAGSQMEEKSF